MHGLIFEISISRLAGSTRYPFPFSRERASGRRLIRACSIPCGSGPLPFQNRGRFTGASADLLPFEVAMTTSIPAPILARRLTQTASCSAKEQRRRPRRTMSDRSTVGATVSMFCSAISARVQRRPAANLFGRDVTSALRAENTVALIYGGNRVRMYPT